MRKKGAMRSSSQTPYFQRKPLLSLQGSCRPRFPLCFCHHYQRPIYDGCRAWSWNPNYLLKTPFSLTYFASRILPPFLVLYLPIQPFPLFDSEKLSLRSLLYIHPMEGRKGERERERKKGEGGKKEGRGKGGEGGQEGERKERRKEGRKEGRRRRRRRRRRSKEEREGGERRRMRRREMETEEEKEKENEGKRGGRGGGEDPCIFSIKIFTTLLGSDTGELPASACDSKNKWKLVVTRDHFRHGNKSQDEDFLASCFGLTTDKLGPTTGKYSHRDFFAPERKRSAPFARRCRHSVGGKFGYGSGPQAEHQTNTPRVQILNHRKDFTVNDCGSLPVATGSKLRRLVHIYDGFPGGVWSVLVTFWRANYEGCCSVPTFWGAKSTGKPASLNNNLTTAATRLTDVARKVLGGFLASVCLCHPS
ncbi:hypothetical protein L345_16978, partial [Ophiophagus hannah]